MPICARSLLSRAEIGAGLSILVAVEPDVVVLRDLEHDAVGRFRLAPAVATADVQRGAVFAFAAGHPVVLLSNGFRISSHSYYNTFRPKMQGFSENFSVKITGRRFLPPDAGGCRTSAEAGQAGLSPQSAREPPQAASRRHPWPTQQAPGWNNPPPHNVEAQRNQQGHVHRRELLRSAAPAVVAEPLGIDAMYLFTERRRHPRGAPDRDVRRQGVLGRGGEVHNLDHGAVLVALIVRHDDGGAPAALLRTNGADGIDIVDIASRETHKICSFPSWFCST